jgi:hypothetical protein
VKKEGRNEGIERKKEGQQSLYSHRVRRRSDVEKIKQVEEADGGRRGEDTLLYKVVREAA